MPKKIPGKLQPPPTATDFDRLPLESLCPHVRGLYYRLHSTNESSGEPWPAVYFSQRGRSRFDPKQGPGTLYLGVSLAGILLEIFDDRWGPVGSINRSITQSELDTWWVSLISIPEILVFETSGLALSKIGTDAQLLCGDHETAQEWALRLSKHPLQIGGISYASRHDNTRRNLALFKRPHLLPEIADNSLLPKVVATWQRETKHGTGLVFGPAVRLREHPDLMNALAELEVGLVP